jgi:hypothetical protein
MEIQEVNVVDVSVTDGGAEHMLAVMLEVDVHCTVTFFRFDELLDEWLLRLVLEFDLSMYIDWVVLDENDSTATETTAWTENTWDAS